MDKLEWVKGLAKTARQEETLPVEVDVKGPVLRRLQTERESVRWQSLRVMTGVSVALSLMVIFLAVPSWTAMSDPLEQMLVPFSLELPWTDQWI